MGVCVSVNVPGWRRPVPSLLLSLPPTSHPSLSPHPSLFRGLPISLCEALYHQNLLGSISPMERLFVLKTLSRTQRATKVKKYVGFSLKLMRCRDPALPPLYGHAYSRPFFLRKARMRIIVWASPRPLFFLCRRSPLCLCH